MKLALGTVQFGTNYGIANSTGKITEKEAYTILDYCKEKGVDTLDTAGSYGDSENVIGNYIKLRRPGFKIISKLPPAEDHDYDSVKKRLCASLKSLASDKIYAYLIHRFTDFTKNEKLYSALIRLKGEGLVEKIGFSIYSPKELDIIFEKKADFDVLQVPYSIFDRRFESRLAELNKRGIEIDVRSVFLQGLVFLDPKCLPPGLSGSGPYLDRLRRMAAKHNLSIAALCLGFVLGNRYVDKVVIGVDSLEHLKNNVSDAECSGRVAEISGRFKELEIEDEDIILPFKWKSEVVK